MFDLIIDYEDEFTSVKKRMYKNIKAIAKKKGINLADVERGAGLTPGYCSQQEFGYFFNVYMISKSLGVSIDQIINGCAE